ncbi:MAG: hypothetical protein WDA17_05505 [Sphaerochaetaceae bacterium]
MKKMIFLVGAILTMSVLFSCKKSTEDEFNGANGDVAQKYIKRFQVIENSKESTTFTINYGANNLVSSVSDGNASAFLNFDGANNLTSVTGDEETLDVNELYQSPYDAFESGTVLKYDDKGNPVQISVFEDGYGSEVITGNILYDPNPNPFFYTLKAGGVIDMLDRVDLNFGYSNPSIVKARMLLPYNSIKTMIFKDAAGITKYEVQIDYNYDADKYPTSATVTAMSQDGTSTITLLYTYK